MENYRSLEAYTFFISGWVQTIIHKRLPAENIIFRADVRPSYRVTEKPHHPWVAVSSEGKVLAAHCDCMAGLGESCSHIAAVLFKIEAAVRGGYTTSACTDEPCQWNACFVKKVEAAPVARINFYKDPVKERLRRSKNIRPRQPAPPSEEQKYIFLQSLAEGPENVVGLCTFKDFSHKFVSTQQIPTKVCLPPSLRTLYEDTHEKLDRAHLMAKCFVHKQPEVTEQQRTYVEMVTRSQSASPVWHEQRVGRITASTAHAALRARDPPPKSLLTRICKSATTPINTPAIVWGRQHEDEAFRVYTDIVTGASASPDRSHVECTTSKAGLHIGETEPFLAATPDGFVNCDCCGRGVIEIKCPYKHRDSSVAAATQAKDFCLDERMALKKDHAYYTQVQMQIYICQVEYADFVVWTVKECAVCRVMRDNDFITSMVSKTSTFWRYAVLPELFTRCLEHGANSDSVAKPSTTVSLAHSQHSAQASTSKVYCVCRSSDETEDMVGCDKCDEWFHLKCIKLTRIPMTKHWYCKACRKGVR